MQWTTAAMAAAPLLVLFGLMAWGRLPAWAPPLAALAAAAFAAIARFQVSADRAAAAALQGVVTSLFPILWIVAGALWVHAIAVESGAFETIRATLAAVTPDRRLQALLIAFGFGGFLEGAAGFGTPVAICAAMLVGLGFEARTAAVVCLLANSAPVAFAAAGVPVAVAAGVSGLDPAAIGRIVAREVALVALLVPGWITVVLCGWRRAKEVLPAVLLAGVLMAGTQLVVTTVSGPWTAGILSGIVTVAGLWLFLRAWKPRQEWDFPGARDAAAAATAARGSAGTGAGTALRAWIPYLLMSAMVVLWSTAPVSALLKRADISIPWPGLPGATLTLPLLSTPGTAIVLSGILSAAILLRGRGARRAALLFGRTLVMLRRTAAVVCLVLATAMLMNAAGMSGALGRAMAGTGALYPLVAPLLGWLGVLVTGSDTSSNALFGALQRTTAERLGLDPALTVAANAAGGVAGKMASPQSIAVAVAAARLGRAEGGLFRATAGHSLAMALLVGLATLFLASLPWLAG